jgi:hypothetical protein
MRFLDDLAPRKQFEFIGFSGFVAYDPNEAFYSVCARLRQSTHSEKRADALTVD